MLGWSEFDPRRRTQLLLVGETVRGLFRFGLPTLFAAMLLCISVAGWQRDRQNDAKEQAALDPLAKENVSVRITRRSEATVQSEVSSAASAEGPEPDSWSAFAEEWTTWLYKEQDPIVTLMIEQVPSDAARKKVLDLPHLEQLWIFGNVYPREGKPYPKAPSLEETFGRALPDLPPATEMADEPPPLPRGTPLSEEERRTLLAQIDAAWAKRGGREPDAELRFASSDDPEHPSVLSVKRGDARFLVQATPGLDAARFHVIDEGRRSVVQRRWETGAWRLEYAARSLDETPVQIQQDDLSAYLLDDPVTKLCGRDFSAKASIESVERLDDGGYLLKRKSGEAAMIDRTAGGLDASWIVVGPAPSFALLRGDALIDRPYVGERVRRIDLLDHDAESDLLLRQSTWILVLPTLGGNSVPCEGFRKRQVRFAREVDPDLPGNLFDPLRLRGDFFTSAPTPSFRWWYVTGVLSIAAFVGIGATNAYGLAKRRFSRYEEDEKDDPHAVASGR